MLPWSLLLLLLCLNVIYAFLSHRPSTVHPSCVRRRSIIDALALSLENKAKAKGAGYVRPAIQSKPTKRKRSNGGGSNRVASASGPSSPPFSFRSSVRPEPFKAEGGGEWVEIFNHLQTLTTRTTADYETAFEACRLLGRPFECLSLIRHMSKDGLPRPIRFYEETVTLASEMGNFNTVLDTYLIFERKEEFHPSCPSIRRILTLALQACERLGKGSRAARIFERCKELQGGDSPAFEQGAAAEMVLRACFRAGTYEIGGPYARLVLETGPALAPDLRTVNMALSTLSKANCSAEARLALSQMRTWGWSRDAVSYGSVLEGLTHEGDLEGALELFACMTQQDNIRPNTVILNILIQACCRSSQLDKALELYQAIPTEERDLHRAHPLWTLATREGNEDAIRWLLKDLAQGEDRLGLSCYHASLCNLARLGLWEPAEELANLMMAKGQNPTPMTFYALVAACEKVDEHERLLSWFQQMLRAKVEPDPLRYGMALQSCERLGRWEAGLALMTNMRDRGLEMGPGLWKRLFLLFGREARGQEALDLLAEMEDCGQRLAPICHEAAVTAFSRMGDKIQAVKSLMTFEEKKGIPMGRGAYTSAIASCRDSKDWETAWQLYHRMKTHSHESPSTLTRAALLAVFVAAQRFGQEAIQIAEEQKVSGEEPPLHMMANLVLVYASREEYEDVLEYFRAIWEARVTNSKAPMGWAVYNAALKACSKLGEYQLALDILQTMKENGATVDVVMYGCALTACSVAGVWKEAFALLKEMEASEEMKPNLVCYTSVITALQKGEEWRKALNLLVKMLNEGPAPDVQAYNAVISACANAGEAHMALKIFHAMKVQGVGVSANEVTYATAIVACWRGNDWRKAVEILNAMRTDGYTPNMITVSLVIDTCDRNKKYDIAAYVFEESVVGYIRSEDYDMESMGPGMVVDLHGYAQPVARAALRAGLKRLSQMYLNSNKNQNLVKDFVFITGRGKHSIMPFEPVLRPAMQEMLTQDFDPPLPTQMVEGNSGRMLVKAKDLVRWLKAQTAERTMTPADLHGGTLKLKSAQDLKEEYENLLKNDGLIFVNDDEEEEEEEMVVERK